MLESYNTVSISIT